jgi:hypothetical protein
MMTLTMSQGQALSALLHQIRKDWDLPGINAAVRKAGSIGSYADLAVAACRLASNPEIRTPALLSEPGTHWQGTAAGKRIAPLMCTDHPDQKAGNCLKCVSEAVPRPAGFAIPRPYRRAENNPAPTRSPQNAPPSRLEQARRGSAQPPEPPIALETDTSTQKDAEASQNDAQESFG